MHSLTLIGVAAICISSTLTGFAAEPASSRAEKNDPRMLVYIGTYTRGDSKGIYVSRLDEKSGVLTVPELAAETTNPSFLALHPGGKFLYAVGEMNTFDGKKAGAVAAFRIDRATGKLTLLNRQPSGGAGPCHLVADKSGKAVLVANYGGGSVAALPIQRDGGLAGPATVMQHSGSSVNAQRQTAPHAHGAYLDAANRFAFIPDLGMDKVMIYRFDPAKAALISHEPPSASLKPGAGPRHMAFHPAGRHAYVINELDSTVTGFAYDAKRGELKEIQTIGTLPADFSGNNTTAEIEVHPSGKFLYASNRGHDSIAIFAANPANGHLASVGHEPTQGKTPRFFGLDPSGRFLFAANQNSNTLVGFRVDDATGRLTPTGQVLEIGSPVCLAFLKVE